MVNLELHEEVLKLLREKYGEENLSVKKTALGKAPTLPLKQEEDDDFGLPQGDILFGDASMTDYPMLPVPEGELN